MPLALAAVLIALAFLQYRWSLEVSNATTTQMQVNLHNALLNFRQDLSGELARLGLEVGGAPARPIEANTLAGKLDHWRRTASQPGLVTDVYLWKPSDGESSIHHLSADKKFEPVAWPSSFDRLREFLTSGPGHQPLDVRGGRPALQPGPPQGPPPGQPEEFRRHASHWPLALVIDQTIPAIVIPAAEFGSDVLIIVLDLPTLEQTVFPQLTSRYFGDSQTAEYEVTVFAGNGTPLYSSSADFSQPKTADAALSLFGPPGPMGGRIHSAVFPPQPGESRKSPATRLAELVHIEPTHYGPDVPGWQIAAKHRKGSVEAAVADLRRRNLAVSFGVLLILATSMGLIIFTSHRARRLAALQMDFVAGVSHELRTPIAAILSVGQNMSDGVLRDNSQVLRYGNIIKNQARQLNHFVEQVLRFSTLRQKAPTYKMQPIQLGNVIREAIENTSNVADAAGFRVECALDDSLPEIVADFEIVSQCLQNLITNAVKYGGDDKWVGIHAYACADSAVKEVCIAVQDHGRGIDKREIKQIFDPFYRSPSVASTQIHGTGLGLTLARNFAESMGGRVTVKSELGKGTAFTVHLPASDGHSTTDAATMNANSSTTST